MRRSFGCEDAGIPYVRFHDLRHTAASEMLRRGLLLREVQYVLGHSSPRMTERYAHFARTFKPPKSLSWSVQQSVMHESARPGGSRLLRADRILAA